MACMESRWQIVIEIILSTLIFFDHSENLNLLIKSCFCQSIGFGCGGLLSLQCYPYTC